MKNEVIIGKNDVKSQYPEIAEEADGWDPSNYHFKSTDKMPWICPEFKHKYSTQIRHRTINKTKCRICNNKEVLKGFNDLKTKSPELAAEADGWDPSLVLYGTHKKLPWKCKLNHTWEASVGMRYKSKTSCPYCSNKKVWTGFNDLQTKSPEIALEAHGWDPSLVLYGTHKKLPWKCKNYGHLWETVVKSRVQKGYGCPYCANQKILVGFNDLKTKSPEIALEAHGWDPTTISNGYSKKIFWKCKNYGHLWETSPSERTSNNPKHQTNCPICANRKLLVGFNDLKTTFPELAEEAYCWDPTTLIAGSHDEKKWKCKTCGNIWTARVTDRSWQSKGCSRCCEYGFNSNKPAWFYLMERKGEQQFGITNNIKQRRKDHFKYNWIELDSTGPHSGIDVENTEKKLKNWLKLKIGTMPNTFENWSTIKLKVKSLNELKKISCIKTNIF